jgi:hypothetical protein
MTQADLARVINSTVEPLSDIGRSSTWRRIEQAISEPERSPARVPRHRVVGGFCIAAVAFVALLLAVRGGSSSSTSTRSSESLVATAGERVDRSWAGGQLTLHGPGMAELVRDGDERVTVIVAEGTAVMRRGADAVTSLSVRTASLETEVTSEVFAVRVYDGITVIATSEQHIDGLVEHLEPVVPAQDAVEPGGEPEPAESEPVVEPTKPEAERPARRIRTPKHAASEPAQEHDAEDTETKPAAEPEPESDPRAEPPTLDEIYASAESAIARGDTDRAVRLLERIVRDDGRGLLATSARYDLALVALGREQYDRALAFVDEIIASGTVPSLKEAARRLRCRILEAQGEPCGE